MPVDLNLGPFALRRGDSDLDRVYSGVVRDVPPEDARYVRNLKEALLTCRILYFGNQVRTPHQLAHREAFDLRTEWALREFQVYAKAPRWLREATGEDGQTRLENGPKTTMQIYRGPVSGILDTATRRVLDLWLSEEWICPVVISSSQSRAPNYDFRVRNVWHRHDDPTVLSQDNQSGRAFFVRDFSGFYEPYDENENPNLMPDGDPLPGELLLDLPTLDGETRNLTVWNSLATFTALGEDGPFTHHRDPWPEHELLPQLLTGEDIPALGQGTAEQRENAARLRSTYKVVRAAGDEECVGFFEGLTAWDNAIMSAGPAHWTLVLSTQGTATAGELPATLGYLKDQYPNTFDAAFARFGLSVDRSWDSGTGLHNGAELANAEQLKYLDFLALQEDENSFSVPTSLKLEGEWLRGWHWTYRFAMAARRFTQWRTVFWDMARIRTRDLLGARVHFEQNDENGEAVERNPTIGEVLTSEATVAFAHRYHIWRPARVVDYRNGRWIPGQYLRPAIVEHYSPGGTDQEALLRSILLGPTFQLPQAPGEAEEEGVESWWRLGDDNAWQNQFANLSIQARRVVNWPYWRRLRSEDGTRERRRLRRNFRRFSVGAEHLYHGADENDIRILVDAGDGTFGLYEAGLPEPWWRAAQPRRKDQLVAALAPLGFDPAGPADRPEQHPAVREFQAAAAMPSLRRLDPNGGIEQRVDNPRRYRGWIGFVASHGLESEILNSVLDRLVSAWQADGHRAPLQMSRYALGEDGGPTGNPQRHDIWRLEETPVRTGIFARDDTGLYGSPESGRQPVGIYVSGRNGIEARNGRDAQGRLARFCLPDAEVTPQSLFGEAEITDPKRRSTFKIVRAVAEELFGGFLDGVSSFEDEGLRFAFWKRPVGASSDNDELGAFLAYLRFAHRDAGRRILDAYGLFTEDSWETLDASGQSDSSGRKIRDRSHLAPGTRIQMGTKRGESSAWTAREEAHFRSWHWANRFQSLVRSDPATRRAVWDFVRLRLRDLLYLSWPLSDQLTYELDSQRSVTVRVGHLLTSERARALLLWLHLLRPSDTVSNREPGVLLRTAFERVRDARRSRDPLPSNVREWDDNVETELIDAMLAQLGTDERRRAERVTGWQYEGPEDVQGFSMVVSAVDASASELELETTRRSAPLGDLGEDFDSLPLPLQRPPGALLPILLRLREPTTAAADENAGLALVAMVPSVPADGPVVAAVADPASPATDPAPALVEVTGIAVTRPASGSDAERGILIPFERPVSVPNLAARGAASGGVLLYDRAETSRSLPATQAAIVGSDEVVIQAGLDVEILFANTEIFRGGARVRLTLAPDDANPNTLKVGGEATVALRAPFLDSKWSLELAIPEDAPRLRVAGNEISADLQLADKSTLPAGLPIRLEQFTATVRLGIDGTSPFLAVLLEAQGLTAELGSPFVQLRATDLGVQASLDTRFGLTAGPTPRSGTDRKLALSVLPFGTGGVGTPASSRVGHVIGRPEGVDEEDFVGALELEVNLDAPEREDLELPAGPQRDVATAPPAAVRSHVGEPVVLWRSARIEVGDVLLKKIRGVVQRRLGLAAFSGESFGGEGPLDVRLRVRELSKSTGSDGLFRVFVDADVDVLYKARHEDERNSRDDETGASPRRPLVFSGRTEIGLEVEFQESEWESFLQLDPRAFRLDPLKITAYTLTPRSVWFGRVASLYVPQGAAFTFDLDPRSTSLSFSDERTRERQAEENITGDLGFIALSVPGRTSEQAGRDAIHRPGDKTFTFELESFVVSPAGLDFAGGVRAENVALWNNENEQVATGLDRPLAVEAPKQDGTRSDRIGEIRVRSGRLVHLMIRASAKLHYFDDAIGTLTVVGSQDEDLGGVKIVGTFDLAGRQIFRLDDIFATVEVTHVVLSSTWHSGNGANESQWLSEGRLTGSLKFAPAKGRTSSELGFFARLFEGVSVSFEDLDIVRLGASKLRIEVTPARFEIAEILAVEIKGLEFFPAREEGGLVVGNKSVRVLGGIELLKLPVVDASLKFGGLNLQQVTGQVLPAVSMESVSLKLSLPSGFRLEGTVAQIDNELEFGLGGTASLETEALPRIDALVKLTRITVRDEHDRKVRVIPSVAVYLEREWALHIYAGFFLRRIGLGVGVYQGLRGLDSRDGRSMPQRIEEFVNDPRGLPNPGQLDSWEPLPPPASDLDRLRWMLVGHAYMTYGNLPSSVEHILAGSLLISIDDGFEITAGANVWIFTSPDQARTNKFYARPLARGAIGISPREGRIYGTFINLPNAAMGTSAPPLLKEVLSQVRTRITFLADRNGVMYEVGWPWDTRIAYSKGPFRGELTSGYRYGIYRGVIAAGINYGIQLRLRAEADLSFGTRWGRAGAKLTARGEAYARASLVGAITPRFELYVLGDARIGASVEVSVSAYVVFRLKLGFIKIKIKISFSVSLTLSISASLAIALTTKGIGFDGSARVAIRVAGFKLEGRIPFRLRAGLVAEARAVLRRLMPPIRQIAGARRSLRARLERVATMRPTALRAAESLAVPGSAQWTVRLRSIAREGRRKELRILLLPKPGTFYPRMDPESPRENKLTFRQDFLNRGFRFMGFLGATGEARIGHDRVLRWTEDLDAVVVDAETVARDAELEPDAASSSTPAILLRDMLEEIDRPVEDEAPSTGFDDGFEERVDPRTRTPSPEDADDPSQDLGAAHPSTRIGRQNRVGEDDRFDGYDEAVATATMPETGDPERGGFSTPMLAADVYDMLADESLRPDRAAEQRPLAALRLVLVFEYEGDQIEAIDPENGIFEPGAEMLSQPADVRQPDEVRAAHREHSLTLGHVFQAEGEIGLVWDLAAEDAIDGIRAHEAVDRIVVTRTNFSRRGDLDGDDPDRSEGGRRAIVTPCWLKPPGETLVRPPFQFVDNELSGVEPGDLLEYVVEARSEIGVDWRQPEKVKVLAKARTLVRYSPVVPLEGVPQSLALHLPKAVGTSGGGLVDIGLLVPAQLLERNRRGMADISIVLRGRRVLAPEVGRYGVGDLIEATTVKEQGIQGRLEEDLGIDEMRFSAPRERQTLPWPETIRLELDLHWTPEELPPAEDDSQQGMGLVRAFIPQHDLFHAASMKAGGAEALELFVGLEEQQEVRAGSRPPRRSPLTRCRLAVAPFASTPWRPSTRSQRTDDEGNESPELDPIASYFRQGNTVRALEDVPHEPRADREWVRAERVHAEGVYDSTWKTEARALKPAAIEEASTPLPSNPVLRVSWWHMRERHVQWGPVVGYRVWLIDRLDPWVEPSTQLRLAAEIGVFPDPYYRAFPDTIAPVGRRRSELGNEVSSVDWQLARDYTRLRPAPEAQELKLGQVEWEGIVEEGSVVRCGFKEVQTAFGPARLSSMLHEHADALALEIERAGLPRPFVRFHISEPLLEQGAEALEQKPLAERIRALAQSFTEENDPYGWLALESMGLSTELKLVWDGEEAVPAEQLWHAERALQERTDSLSPATRLALRYVRLVGFLGEDEKTPLDVWRSVVSFPSSPSSWRFFGPPLGLLLKGRRVDANLAVQPADDLTGLDLSPDPEAGTPDPALLTLLDGFYRKIESSLSRLHPTPESDAATITRLVRRSGLDERIVRDLPVVSGRVTFDLPVDDLLAHEYELAIETVRRRELRKPDESGPSALAPNVGALSINGEDKPGGIPAVKGRIERTKPLPPHALVASSLPGSVEALVFVHPAAYAAMASAPNASRGQYSGQHVSLQLRVAEHSVIETACARWRDGGFDWVSYAAWTRQRASEIARGTKTSFDPSRLVSQADGAPHPMDPVSGTERGLYGVDRYVVPNVPPDYEYRVVAWSTAGRIQSPWVASGYVRPSFEPIRRETFGDDDFRDLRGRLSPEAPTTSMAQAISKSEIATGGKGCLPLRLVVPVVTPYTHMTELTRPLWIEAEREVATAGNVKLGLMPDFRAEYQLYLVANLHEASDGEAGPIAVPIVRIHPVISGRKLRDHRNPFYGVEVVMPGIRLLRTEPYLPPPGGEGPEENDDADAQLGRVYSILPELRATGAEDGMKDPLFFRIDVDVSDPRCGRIARSVRAAGDLLDGNGGKGETVDIPGLLFVDVARDGHRSIMRTSDRHAGVDE